jgi:glycogen synthase
MIRVLHCIYDDPGNPWVAGGGSVRVREIYRRLVDRLARITVATGSYSGARDETIDGIRHLRLGASSPHAWSRVTYSIAASRMLARGDYDAAVYDFSTYTPLWLPRGRPVGITVHHVTGATASARWGGILGRLVAEQEVHRLRGARIYSATSRITLRRLRSLVGPEAEIQLVGAGVSDELFTLPRRESDYLLYFGRLDWFQKGLDTLLATVALLVRDRPDLRVKIAGRGKDRERVLQGARALGLANNVEVVGSVGDEERNRLLSGALVLLMPSRFEGFGMVAAEAMAAGVPLVASSADSLVEVVAPPEGGVIVPPGDAEAMAGAVDRLLRNPVARQELSRTARRAAERFRWDRIAEQHLSFLERIRVAGAPAEERG